MHRIARESILQLLVEPMARPWLDVFNIIRLIPKEQIQGRQRREEKTDETRCVNMKIFI